MACRRLIIAAVATLVLASAVQAAPPTSRVPARRLRTSNVMRCPRSPGHWLRRGFVQLTAGPGYHVRRPERAWGTPLVVRRLREIAAAYRRRFPAAATLWIHDISRRTGGRSSGHTSHCTGQDVDLRLALRGKGQGFVDATGKTLHIERTWFLLLSLLKTCDVELIFLDRGLQRALWEHARRRGVSRRELAYIFRYPYRRASGVVRHADHHKNHMHVRFRLAGVPLDLHGAVQLCRPQEEGGINVVERLSAVLTRR
jgi:murein endopeptidase